MKVLCFPCILSDSEFGLGCYVMLFILGTSIVNKVVRYVFPFELDASSVKVMILQNNMV
jgi:hypothetical protein